MTFETATATTAATTATDDQLSSTPAKNRNYNKSLEIIKCFMVFC